MKDDGAEMAANTRKSRREPSRKRRSLNDLIRRKGLSRPPSSNAECIRKCRQKYLACLFVACHLGQDQRGLEVGTRKSYQGSISALGLLAPVRIYDTGHGQDF